MAGFGFIRLLRAVILAMAVAFSFLLLGGCFAGRGATRAPGPNVEPKVATRTELLVDLKARMARLATLKAKAIMTPQEVLEERSQRLSPTFPRSERESQDFIFRRCQQHELQLQAFGHRLEFLDGLA